jgi:hypothetical protein
MEEDVNTIIIRTCYAVVVTLLVSQLAFAGIIDDLSTTEGPVTVTLDESLKATPERLHGYRSKVPKYYRVRY